MAKSGAWKAPKDLTITERQANGYWSDRSQDRDQEAAPELRTQSAFQSGWPKSKHYRIQKMHMGWAGDDPGVVGDNASAPNTDGKGRFAARTDKGPVSKGQFKSNRGGRIKRNTYAQAGKTG